MGVRFEAYFSGGAGPHRPSGLRSQAPYCSLLADNDAVTGPKPLPI
jgi:hypothetical protein